MQVFYFLSIICCLILSAVHLTKCPDHFAILHNYFHNSCVRLLLLTTSPMTTLNFQHGMKVIQPVTSQGCFGDAKIAANFELNQLTSKG